MIPSPRAQSNNYAPIELDNNKQNNHQHTYTEGNKENITNTYYENNLIIVKNLMLFSLFPSVYVLLMIVCLLLSNSIGA